MVKKNYDYNNFINYIGNYLFVNSHDFCGIFINIKGEIYLMAIIKVDYGEIGGG